MSKVIWAWGRFWKITGHISVPMGNAVFKDGKLIILDEPLPPTTMEIREESNVLEFLRHKLQQLLKK